MAITINDQEPFDSTSPLTIIKALSNLATQIRLLSGSGSWNEAPSTSLNQLSIPGWNIISTNSNLAKNQNNLIKVSGLVITVPIQGKSI